MWKSDLPTVITAGTTIEWVDEATTAGINKTISSPDWTLEYYLRTNTASEGHTATGTQYSESTGWQFTISATDSAGFAAGNWFWVARAFKSSDVFEIGSGELEVKQNLQYTGTPSAIDNRSQNEIDLDAVTAAIRAIIADKASEYSIGNRRFKRIDLPELRAREAELKARVFSEKRYSLISQGLGDPKNLYVRF
tara:strand:+ start:2457 stop:3038 length:582 start_codon:yes stop_codon:yes gene_type:complete